MALQDVLNYLGYNIGDIDGVFETKPKNVAKRFQTTNRLSQYGILDCQTWKSITSEF